MGVWRMEDSKEIDDAHALLQSGKLEEALSAFLTLKERGHRGVSTSIGWIYDNLPNRNRDKAIEYYRLGSDEGDPYAQHALGGIYRSRNELDEAIRYYKLAAANGRPECLFLVARLAELKGDASQAEEYLSRAVEVGDPFAVRNRAFDYMTGKHGVRNIPRGLFLYVRNVPKLLRAAKDPQHSP
jgi:TPR repeat protein